MQELNGMAPSDFNIFDLNHGKYYHEDYRTCDGWRDEDEEDIDEWMQEDENGNLIRII